MRASTANPILTFGAELFLINQALLEQRMRADADRLFDTFEADIYANETGPDDVLAFADNFRRRFAQQWHDAARDAIAGGDVALGVTYRTVGLATTLQRFDAFLEKLQAEQMPLALAPPETVCDA